MASDARGLRAIYLIIVDTCDLHLHELVIDASATPLLSKRDN
jgi:hypothetical protein